MQRRRVAQTGILRRFWVPHTPGLRVGAFYFSLVILLRPSRRLPRFPAPIPVSRRTLLICLTLDRSMSYCFVLISESNSHALYFHAIPPRVANQKPRLLLSSQFASTVVLSTVHTSLPTIPLSYLVRINTYEKHRGGDVLWLTRSKLPLTFRRRNVPKLQCSDVLPLPLPSPDGHPARGRP